MYSDVLGTWKAGDSETCLLTSSVEYVHWVIMCCDLFDITKFVTIKSQLSVMQYVVRPDDNQVCNYEVEMIIHL